MFGAGVFWCWGGLAGGRFLVGSGVWWLVRFLGRGVMSGTVAGKCWCWARFHGGVIGGAFWTAVVIGWLVWLIVVGVVVDGFLDWCVFFSLGLLARAFSGGGLLSRGLLAVSLLRWLSLCAGVFLVWEWIVGGGAFSGWGVIWWLAVLLAYGDLLAWGCFLLVLGHGFGAGLWRGDWLLWRG